jgi:hypothetical protein
MSLAAFNAETASGEGAHGPDRSRHAKCNHSRTNRQKGQSASGGVNHDPERAGMKHADQAFPQCRGGGDVEGTT